MRWRRKVVRYEWKIPGLGTLWAEDWGTGTAEVPLIELDALVRAAGGHRLPPTEDQKP